MIVLNITIAGARLASRPRVARLVHPMPHRCQDAHASLPTEPPGGSSKRLELGVKIGIPVAKIEKPHLTHQPRLPLSTNRQTDSKSTTPEPGESCRGALKIDGSKRKTNVVSEAAFAPSRACRARRRGSGAGLRPRQGSSDRRERADGLGVAGSRERVNRLRPCAAGPPRRRA